MRTQTFGIEMETTGLGRERTAKAIAAYFGTEAMPKAAFPFGKATGLERIPGRHMLYKKL